MKTIITPAIVAQFAASSLEPEMLPKISEFTDAKVSGADHPSGSIFELGCRFHSLLRRIADHDRLTRSERTLLPWLRAMRDALRSVGVEYLTPEVPLAGAMGLPGGRCDLLMEGGLASSGIAEVKVVGSLPEQPHAGDLLQCLGYEALLRQNRKVRTTWVCLVYVCFSQRTVRIFSIQNHGELRDSARRLLAA